MEAVQEKPGLIARLTELKNPRFTPPDYVVEQIEARPGKFLRSLHFEAENAPCYIIHAKVGERALLMCQFDYDPWRYHYLHTSTVEAVIESVDGKSVVIMTQNTNYTLKRTNFTQSFKGVQKLGDEIAYVLP